MKGNDGEDPAYVRFLALVVALTLSSLADADDSFSPFHLGVAGAVVAVPQLLTVSRSLKRARLLSTALQALTIRTVVASLGLVLLHTPVLSRSNTSAHALLTAQVVALAHSSSSSLSSLGDFAVALIAFGMLCWRAVHVVLCVETFCSLGVEVLRFLSGYAVLSCLQNGHNLALLTLSCALSMFAHLIWRFEDSASLAHFLPALILCVGVSLWSEKLSAYLAPVLCVPADSIFSAGRNLLSLVALPLSKFGAPAFFSAPVLCMIPVVLGAFLAIAFYHTQKHLILSCCAVLLAAFCTVCVRKRTLSPFRALFTSFLVVLCVISQLSRVFYVPSLYSIEQDRVVSEHFINYERFRRYYLPPLYNMKHSVRSFVNLANVSALYSPAIHEYQNEVLVDGKFMPFEGVYDGDVASERLAVLPLGTEVPGRCGLLREPSFAFKSGLEWTGGEFARPCGLPPPIGPVDSPGVWVDAVLRRSPLEVRESPLSGSLSFVYEGGGVRPSALPRPSWDSSSAPTCLGEPCAVLAQPLQAARLDPSLLPSANRTAAVTFLHGSCPKLGWAVVVWTYMWRERGLPIGDVIVFVSDDVPAGTVALIQWAGAMVYPIPEFNTSRWPRFHTKFGGGKWARTFNRFFAHDMLKDRYDYFVYSDADVIVLDDVAHVFKVLEARKDPAKYIAAVPDGSRLLSGMSTVFNSGCFFMQVQKSFEYVTALEWWIDDLERSVGGDTPFAGITSADQEIFSQFHRNEIMALPSSYNGFAPTSGGYGRGWSDLPPYLVHFIGKRKPWEFTPSIREVLCRNPKKHSWDSYKCLWLQDMDKLVEKMKSDGLNHELNTVLRDLWGSFEDF